jgi:hypothetical protein
MRANGSDFAGWAKDKAQAILEGRWSDIDRAALADEVESLGKRDRREIRSRLEVVFLRWKIAPAWRPKQNCRFLCLVRIDRRERERPLRRGCRLRVSRK